MLSTFHDHEFKDLNLLKKFEEIKLNKFYYIRKWYEPDLINFFCQIKKVFKIAPITIKLNETQKAQDIRELILYLMILSIKDLNLISQEMKISEDDLIRIKDNHEELEIKYEKEITTFYESMMRPFLFNERAKLAMKDFFS
jgi:hypothetical protein